MLDHQRPGSTRPAPGRTSTRSTSSRARSCASPIRSGRRTPASPTGRRTTSTTEPGKPFYLGYGIFNLGPCPLAGRQADVLVEPQRLPAEQLPFTAPNLQLFVMDNDGSNVELVGHMNLGSALHPTVSDRRAGDVLQLRGAGPARLAQSGGCGRCGPTARNWEPLMSAFDGQNAFHFQTQLSNGDIAVVEYYNQNNNAFGTVLAFPARSKTRAQPRLRRSLDQRPGQQRLRSSAASGGSTTATRATSSRAMEDAPLSPPGLYAISAFSHGEDNASS